MKFKAQTKAKYLLDWFRTICAVADECIIDTSSRDAVDVQVICPANAQMVVMQIPGLAWDVLEADACRFGVDLERLIGKVELFDPDTDVCIALAEHEVHDASGEPSGVRTWLYLADNVDVIFGMAPLDISKMREPPKEPDLSNLPAQFTVDAGGLQRAIRRAASVNDNIWMGMSAGGRVRMWAESDKENYEEWLSRDSIVVHRAAAVRSLFALDYVLAIVPAMQGDVLVRLGQDKAVQMSFEVHGAVVRYIQAPRIE